jgi:hypothetical protein
VKNKIRNKIAGAKKEEMKKKSKVMSEHAFKKWCEKKKMDDIDEKRKQQNKPLTYEEREKQYRQKNIMLSKQNSKNFRYNAHKRKSKSKRKTSRRKTNDPQRNNKPPTTTGPNNYIQK